MEKEKERLEMQKIEEKYGSELLCEVRKDKGLPTLPVPKMLPSASPNPTTSNMETFGNIWKQTNEFLTPYHASLWIHTIWPTCKSQTRKISQK